MLLTAKITSPPSRDCWPQIYLENGLLLVVKVKSPSPSLARTIVSRFNEVYQEQSQKKSLARLSASLKIMEREFGEIRPDILAGVIFNQVLYLGILNRGRVALFREGKLVTVLSGQGGISTASGFLKENDLLVLATEKFFQLLTVKEVTNNMEKKEPEAIVEALNFTIQSKEINSGIAGVIVKFQMKKISNQMIKKLIALLPNKIYLRKREPNERKQRMMMTIAVLLVALLLVSVIFGWQKGRKEKDRQEFNQFWQEIEHQYQEGKELTELNPTLARKLLKETLLLIEDHKVDYSEKSWQYQKLIERKKEAEIELNKVLREYHLSEIPTFLDLNLVKKGLKGIDFDFWEEKIVVLGEDGTVITIDANKKTKTLGREENARLIAFLDERAFVLNKEIKEVGQETVLEKDWDEVIDLQAFAGNLYLLDKGQNQILKLPAIEEGIGAPRNWLVADVEVDLGQAKAMAIDGEIWVLLVNAEILRFNRGVLQPFVIGGLPIQPAGGELKQANSLFTNDNSQKLYILDKVNKRILVFSKSGDYDSQYLWKGLENVTHLVVSEKQKKIYLLSGDKIYEVEIK